MVVVVAGLIIVARLLFGSLVGPAAEGQMRLRWGHNMDESYPSIAAAKRFVAAVENPTKGAVKVEIYPAITL
jgi:TRAP-type C4-dicarboxylate transport system substrate-binding protein